MTFYLKYRPQTLADLDQELVRDTLTKIFSSKDTPHAFLFSGPRGTGKTSAARIIAKIINCEHPVKGEPCNECGQCKAISKGESLDVIELDAASHRGIDDVRQIKEAVKLSPVTAKKKVYIIDEAHMLTTEASNALLKTLEEPPDHVVFILATTNPEKLLETIRSRVTNVHFKKAKKDEIVRSLKRIVVAENANIDDKSLEVIADNADGSFRDAVKTLEQIISEVKTLDDKSINEYLTRSGSFDTLDFLKCLSDKKVKEALQIIARASESGLSSKEMAKLIIGTLRGMLLSEVGVGEPGSRIFTKGELILLIELFSDTASKLQYAYIEEVPLEVATIKWCEGIDKEIKSSDPTKKVSNGKQSESGMDKKASISTAPVINTKVVEAIGHKNEHPKTAKPEDVIEADENGLSKLSHSSLKEVDGDFWSKILATVRSEHASTEALLRASKPIGFDGNTLKLGVFYKFHKEHLESNQHRLVLERIVGSMTGSDGIRVVCELAEPPVKSHMDVGYENSTGLSDIVLTEPKGQISTNALTNGKTDDIINLAEKIFSN